MTLALVLLPSNVCTISSTAGQVYPEFFIYAKLNLCCCNRSPSSWRRILSVSAGKVEHPYHAICIITHFSR